MTAGDLDPRSPPRFALVVVILGLIGVARAASLAWSSHNGKLHTTADTTSGTVHETRGISPSFLIHAHPAVHDKHVSGSIARSGSWELDTVKRVKELMLRVNGAVFLGEALCL